MFVRSGLELEWSFPPIAHATYVDTSTYDPSPLMLWPGVRQLAPTFSNS
jgi:hypothetical protein